VVESRFTVQFHREGAYNSDTIRSQTQDFSPWRAMFLVCDPAAYVISAREHDCIVTLVLGHFCPNERFQDRRGECRNCLRLCSL